MDDDGLEGKKYQFAGLIRSSDADMMGLLRKVKASG
jgi:hypothetical protein